MSSRNLGLSGEVLLVRLYTTSTTRPPALNMNQQLPWIFVRFLLLFVMVGACVGAAEALGDARASPTTLEHLDAEGDGGSASPRQHHLRKRFIWTLTQEPYFYGKYGRGGEGEGRGQLGGEAAPGAEMLPEALALRNPTSMHKRLYPRWYQAYVYKNPSFNGVAGPVVGERKRFHPFHPLARFRGLASVGSSYPSGYRAQPDLPLSDDPGHRLPTAPNAQTSYKYDASSIVEEEQPEEEEEEEERPVKAGELLQLLRTIASDRGLTSHTKGFRFGISRRK
ncbi:uncharacterized protein [Panulirus ornatus]|uniref:uncharacterized protein isoform X2 n=1 Tax=Panulirus ornatus TaxID=150431 RepID=UPI003A8706BF